jgi:hypothetical protein
MFILVTTAMAASDPRGIELWLLEAISRPTFLAGGSFRLQVAAGKWVTPTLWGALFPGNTATSYVLNRLNELNRIAAPV